MLAQQFPERPAVFLHRGRGASDVSLVRTQDRREKVVLESLDGTRLRRSERLLVRSGPVLGQVKIRQLDRVAIGELRWRASARFGVRVRYLATNG